MQRPFQCRYCQNWYTPVPMDPDMMCRLCAEGQHAAHQRTGVVDCHWGHTSATPSEIALAKLVTQAEAALVTCERARKGPSLPTLTEAEAAMAQFDQGQAKVPELLLWAGVMEMPGKQDDKPESRYKGLDAIASMVNIHRRPATDLEMLQRSVKVCGELAAELPSLGARAREALGQARQASAGVSVASETDEAKKTAARERMARVRAARKPREAVAVGE